MLDLNESRANLVLRIGASTLCVFVTIKTKIPKKFLQKKVFFFCSDFENEIESKLDGEREKYHVSVWLFNPDRIDDDDQCAHLE